MFENSSKKDEISSENAKGQITSGKPNLGFKKMNAPKNKVTVINESIIKYLRSKNLSSKNYKVKIAAHRQQKI